MHDTHLYENSICRWFNKTTYNITAFIHCAEAIIGLWLFSYGNVSMGVFSVAIACFNMSYFYWLFHGRVSPDIMTRQMMFMLALCVFALPRGRLEAATFAVGVIVISGVKCAIDWAESHLFSIE